MKRFNRIFFLTALFSAAAAFAPAQESTSEQAVGFVRIELERGKQTIVSLPFDSFDGQPQTTADLLGDTLPANSALVYWDAPSQTFRTERYQRPGLGSPLQWTAGSGQTPKAFVRGEAFFITIPANAPAASYTLVLTGVIPDGPDSDTEVVLPEGLVLIGIPYPVTTRINNADLDLGPVEQESLNVWSPESGVWQRKGFARPGLGQNPAWDENLPELKPGQGFFYRVQNGRTWSLTRSKLYESPLAPLR